MLLKSAKLRKTYLNFKAKCQTIFNVIKADNVAFTSLVRPEDQIRGIILSTLRKHITPKNIEQENALHGLVDSLINDILVKPEGPLKARIQETLDGMFSSVYWYYCTLSGAATYATL